MERSLSDKENNAAATKEESALLEREPSPPSLLQRLRGILCPPLFHFSNARLKRKSSPPKKETISSNAYVNNFPNVEVEEPRIPMKEQIRDHKRVREMESVRTESQILRAFILGGDFYESRIEESPRLMEKKIVRPREEIISSLTSFSNTYVASYVPPISLIHDQDQDQDHSQTNDLSLGCLVTGHLSFGNSDRNVNCANLRTVLNGICVDKIVAMKNEGALFILLVGNKDAFMKLAECEPRFIDTFPCIIVSAEEQPSDGMKRFLRMMKRDLKLPVLALVDRDPVGMKILSAYASLDLDIKWLGVRRSDIDRYNVPKRCILNMTPRDAAIGNELLRDEIVDKNLGWLSELLWMMRNKKKVEVLEFDTISPEYLLEVYLPLKLQEMDWI